MQTLEITTKQIRHALYVYDWATDYVLRHSIEEIKNQANQGLYHINSKFEYSEKVDGKFYSFPVIIKENEKYVSKMFKFNDTIYDLDELKRQLNDLSDDEQKYALENLYIGAIEKYISKRTDAKIKFKKFITYRDGQYRLDLYTDNLIDKTGICKAMLKEIFIECRNIHYAIDENGLQYLSIPVIDFRYNHHAGGSNGYEIGRVRWNTEIDEFEGWDYDTLKYEVI